MKNVATPKEIKASFAKAQKFITENFPSLVKEVTHLKADVGAEDIGTADKYGRFELTNDGITVRAKKLRAKDDDDTFNLWECTNTSKFIANEGKENEKVFEPGDMVLLRLIPAEA